MIPKRIFNIWISDHEYPSISKSLYNSWKTHLPPSKYEYIEVRKKDVLHLPFVRSCIECGKFGPSTDFIRSYYLYHYGGIYLDNDIEILKPLDPFLHHQAFFCKEGVNHIGTGVLGSVKNHWLHKHIIDKFANFDASKLKTLEIFKENSTALFAKGFTREDVYEEMDGTAIYPSKYFYPYHWSTRFDPSCIKPETYAIHYWHGSWAHTPVSIIIPCYNYGRYLSDAISSALAQTYKPQPEVIVIDDGSTDNTAEVAAYYPEVKYIYQPNKGVAVARNRGIKESNGQWICCLDADDTLDPHYIEKLMAHKMAGSIICPSTKEFGDSSNVWHPAYPHKEMSSLNYIIRQNASINSALFKKSLWRSTGGYDESEKFDGAEDWEFWVHCISKGAKIIYLREPLFNYRKHGPSKYSLKTVPNYPKIKDYIFNKHKAALHNSGLMRLI